MLQDIDQTKRKRQCWGCDFGRSSDNTNNLAQAIITNSRKTDYSIDQSLCWDLAVLWRNFIQGTAKQRLDKALSKVPREVLGKALCEVLSKALCEVPGKALRKALCKIPSQAS